MTKDIEIPSDAVAALQRGSKIEALKMIREQCGGGLKDEKEQV
jgi:ribosomal protein L7/L12